MNLISAEIRKLAYQRSTYGLLIAGVALSVLSTAFSPIALDQLAGEISMPLSDPNNIDGIYAKALGAYIVVVVLGVRFMAGEFHHHTAIATFLSEPRRHRVLFSKLLVAAVAGAAFNVVATIIGMASGWIALQFFADAAEPHPEIFVNFPLSAALIGAVLAVMGVGIGAVIRNHNVATAASLIWLFLVDRIIAVIWVAVGKFMPTGLITSMMNLQISVSDSTDTLSLDTDVYLEPLPAALILLGYGILFSFIAIATSLRRDID